MGKGRVQEERSPYLKKWSCCEEENKKKLHWHTTYGTVSLREQIFYQAGLKKNIRAFSLSAAIHCRGYSRPLQRAITDFGGDYAFGQVEVKLKEHYGITVPTSSARRITQRHAHEMYEQERKEWVTHSEPTDSGRSHPIILGETDGSMVPIVKTKPKPEGEEKYDARKHKEYFWREARLSLAHEIGSVTPVFAATLGGVDEVGQQIRMCVDKVGRNDETKIHCIGDGATWIANQIEEQFGSQSTYLVDFYHVCEYLAEAAPTCDGGKGKKEWIEKQKNSLKAGRLEETFNALEPYREPSSVKDCDAPVRRCYRYLDNRRNQLDYAKAIAHGLPIGSGEVESAHRYVIQRRLKLPGAWWKEENAADMLALRTNKANQNWSSYWQSKKPLNVGFSL